MNRLTFETIVQDYIQEKKAIGNKFTKAEQTLKRVVALQNEIDKNKPILSRALFMRWAEKTSWEKPINQSTRLSVLRGLSKYMIRHNYQAVFIPVRYVPYREYEYLPYIFSDGELGRILKAVDNWAFECDSFHARMEFPLVIRLLIGSGLRISETLSIEKDHLDLKTNTLFLNKTKNQSERIIPIADSLGEKLTSYREKTSFIPAFSSSRWLFPNPEGEPYYSGTFYQFFRKMLWKVDIPHRGKGKGPRLHDLRHTYAVRVITNWVRNGYDVTTSLPYLAIYMGHSGIKASQHYLRLTKDMYPDLLGMVGNCYSWIIPEVVCEE